MHIPTELFLIFARNSGITTGDQPGAFKEIEVYSCSSCGICIDACQLNFSAGITNIQSAYLMKGIRNNENVNDIAFIFLTGSQLFQVGQLLILLLLFLSNMNRRRLT
jgi:ferredoxin